MESAFLGLSFFQIQPRQAPSILAQTRGTTHHMSQEIVDFCNAQQIAITAYFSLGGLQTKDKTLQAESEGGTFLGEGFL